LRARPEDLGHAAAVIGVGSSAGGDHPQKITGRDGVGGGAAKTLAGVFAFNAALGSGQTARDPWRSSYSMCPAARCCKASWFGTVKNRLDTQLLGTGDHLLGCHIDCRGYRDQPFLLIWFFFCH
jgi:hypothetical protein